MSDQSGIRPFLCDTIEKASIRTEWQKWVRAFQLYLDSENIQNSSRKRNKLLHLGGVQLQEVAYNIPGAVAEHNEDGNNDVFKILVDALTKYFSPLQNSTFERHTFRNIKPGEGETLNKFLIRLRQQATKCSFGNTADEATEINIKDKIIDHWAPLELKKKLLEKERTLEEIIDLCQVHEQITDQSRAMDAGTINLPGTSVNKISVRDQGIQECFRCRGNHLGTSSNCPAKNSRCHKCDLVGHFASKCKTKQRKRPYSGGNNGFKRKRGTSSRVNYLDQQTSDEENQREGNNPRSYECFKIDNVRHPKSLFKQDELIECKVGGVSITLLIDSGSKANIINGRDWKLLTNKKAVV
ncbi:uncharacterized protein [Leptinotarsa decemlineata]|uniref:uncharacterized protein n=1 Tax=Leptinotarsa decemlineata TaxID=7539 RepID=UPI003D306236